ncbi:DUF1972 domain-containing protein [Namhaeicola litoreus]|uniref:DUF1972 domain-containing protein n=1 Tax=Namhaeicola litoreus TaxID=1052145 RepID=A0ABW3Y0F4_9FLAO
MNIGIIGTKGIPNRYGGFEQFAEFLSVYLVEKGHSVTVYCPNHQSYKSKIYKGVNLVFKTEPSFLGPSGQFIYDFHCLRHARKADFDILLQLGYTSNTIWWFLLPKNAVVLSNMDGLEWQRVKYNYFVRRFLRIAEYLAVKSSDICISDSIEIKKYLRNKYKIDTAFIAYGAVPFEQPEASFLKKYEVEPYGYSMLIARMEKENNIEMILDGYVKGGSEKPFIVIGDAEGNSFGRYLINKFKANSQIRFLGQNYNQEDLNNLRFYARAYFHGHSVGGTNPSLIEAMASQAFVIAHNNVFNKAVLNDDAFYFKNVEEVADYSLTVEKKNYLHFVNKNLQKVKEQYSLEKIHQAYLNLFETACKKS